MTRATKAAQVGNVVPIRTATQSAAEIARDVQLRNKAMNEEVLAGLVELNRQLKQRTAETLAEVPAIGRALAGINYQALLDWIEVGRRMAGQGRRA